MTVLYQYRVRVALGSCVVRQSVSHPTSSPSRIVASSRRIAFGIPHHPQPSSAALRISSPQSLGSVVNLRFRSLQPTASRAPGSSFRERRHLIASIASVVSVSLGFGVWWVPESDASGSVGRLVLQDLAIVGFPPDLARWWDGESGGIRALRDESRSGGYFWNPMALGVWGYDRDVGYVRVCIVLYHGIIPPR
ncbi:hypothetical protein EX30DRAFT_344598 [Ascodesmis nigricans]|uniref:Uncharacterized protein n=1 Tax=Ascodesmis nigricans TaxID=341454 RepID=A0A4S2MJ55_9PEZI|nr:hypothetical protein EX30DRAFT_344598 [Ascodesmis nigricans]